MTQHPLGYYAASYRQHLTELHEHLVRGDGPYIIGHADGRVIRGLIEAELGFIPIHLRLRGRAIRPGTTRQSTAGSTRAWGPS